MMYTKAFINGQVFGGDKFYKANLYLDKDKIAQISNDILPSEEVIDCNGLIILPGLIDPHVHFALNVGQYVSCDDFYHGSLSAIYGGVTTIVDFLDPSHNAEELIASYESRRKLATNSLIDYHFHACIASPNGDLEQYVKTCLTLGIRTIKLFTTYSDSNRRTCDKDIIELLKLSEKYKVMILAHIEADDMITLKKEFTYKDLPISRPSYSETFEALKLASYVKTYGGYLYMVHCSSGETLKELHNSYNDILGKHLFIESCPQYFVFNNRFIEGDNGRLFTFAPPLRSERERQLLIANFDYINTIATDHCPFMKKDKDYPSLIGFPLGVGGVEHSFNLLYRRFDEKVINKMSKNVAMLNKFKNKGELKVGYDGDIAIFKVIDNYRIHENHSRCDYSLYDGVLAAGEFIHVLSRGEFVLKDRKIIKNKGREIKCDDYESNN